MLETIIVLLLIGLDQLAKYLTDLYLMPLGTSIPLWEGVFHFTSAHNTGAAFGMLAGGRWFFIAVSLLASAAIVLFLVKSRKRLHIFMRVCFALILAGALGNLIDRAILGYVRDMLEFRLARFAIFNVADSAVSVGAVLLGLDIIFGKGKALLDELDKKTKKPVAAPEAQTPEKTEQDPPEGARGDV